MPISILAIVVTHNRKELLLRCLGHLKNQKRLPDEIVVIDNGSSDGTLIALQNQDVTVITQENVGSAGGWYRGIQYALDRDFDAVWLMDDDGYPDVGALELLQLHLTGTVVCASSVVVREDQPERFVFPFPILDDQGFPSIFTIPRKIPFVKRLEDYAIKGVYPFAHFFNGALIKIDAVKKVGNVNRDYFMFGDEVDYYFRLRKAGDVISVIEARHFHPDVSKRPYTAPKIYYFIKNTLILNHRYMNRSGLRNVLAVLAVLARTLRRNGVWFVMEYIFGKQRYLVPTAVIRGLKGVVAKDFDA